MIWLSEYFDFFIQNLLRLDYEKILLLTSAIFRGDYHLAAFVSALKEDFANNKGEWENPDIEIFLDAMSAWVFSMENLYNNLGKPLPIEPSCKVFAEILLASKVYE